MTSKRRKKHKPEPIVAKLRDADAMLNAGKDLAAVLQALEISEPTLVVQHSFCKSGWGLKVPQKKRERRRFGTSANGCHRRRAEGANHE